MNTTDTRPNGTAGLVLREGADWSGWFWQCPRCPCAFGPLVIGGEDARADAEAGAAEHDRREHEETP